MGARLCIECSQVRLLCLGAPTGWLDLVEVTANKHDVADPCKRLNVASLGPSNDVAVVGVLRGDVRRHESNRDKRGHERCQSC